jgi:hypothetical protein
VEREVHSEPTVAKYVVDVSNLSQLTTGLSPDTETLEPRLRLVANGRHVLYFHLPGTRLTSLRRHRERV